MLLGSRSLPNQVGESFQMMINAVKQLEPDFSHKGADFCACVTAQIPPAVLRLVYTLLLARVSTEGSLGHEINLFS